jgi:Secretion system C-terminal sorting domain
MRNKIIITSFVVFFAISSFAQQIPVGSCGFVYIHDAAGNRIKRVYFCNNNIDPYPESRIDINQFANSKDIITTDKKSYNVEFQPIEAIYPNPTTGIFNIEFSSSLSNSNINILDINGKVVQKYQGSGHKLICNLIGLASGVYFVRIENKGMIVSKKIVKN